MRVTRRSLLAACTLLYVHVARGSTQQHTGGACSCIHMFSYPMPPFSRTSLVYELDSYTGSLADKSFRHGFSFYILRCSFPPQARKFFKTQ
jgi:hypothetical protein